MYITRRNIGTGGGGYPRGLQSNEAAHAEQYLKKIVSKHAVTASDLVDLIEVEIPESLTMFNFHEVNRRLTRSSNSWNGSIRRSGANLGSARLPQIKLLTYGWCVILMEIDED